MGIFGFTWADGGAFVGGALGGAFLGPPGAMLGSAAGSFAGATWGDDKSGGAALEEAVVAGIGAAGGAWATDLVGVLLRNGITSAASRTLSAGAARQVDRVASKVLLPWNSYGGGPVSAFGGAIGGYEVSAQARLPVRIATTDIGNGGCPARMANLRMPAELAGQVADTYRDLPGYLCDVWRSFGTGTREAPPAPELPAAVSDIDAGIPEYAAKARRLNTMMAGFAELDARAMESIAGGVRRISDEGRVAVGSLIDTVNRRAAETPPAGASAQTHALDLLNDAFGRGREILSQAVASSDRAAGRVSDLTGEFDALRKEFDSYKKEHVDGHTPRPMPPAAPPVPAVAPVPATPPPVVPWFVPAPPFAGTTAPGAAAAASARAQVRPSEFGAPVAAPPLSPIQAGPGTGSVAAVPGVPAPIPTPWTRQAVAGAAPDPLESRTSARDPRAAESATPIPAIPGWVVPSFVPAAWSAAGIGASSGLGASPGPATSTAPAVPAAPGRTPWTGLTATPVPVVAGIPAGSWGTPAAAARARTASETEREPGSDDPGGGPEFTGRYGVLVGALPGPYCATDVFAGPEVPR